MPLAPEVQKLLASAPSLAPMIFERGAAAHRTAAALRLLGPPQGTLNFPGVRVTDTAVASQEGHEIAVRVYQPEATGPYATMLNFHGGGWAIGTPSQDDRRCARIVAETGVMILSVKYRLAPEFPYPAAISDGMTVLRWAAARADQFQADPERLAVSGSSAGGNIAAVLALLCRDRAGPPLRFQFLNYPVLDGGLDQPSYRQFASGYGVSREMMAWFWDVYAGDRDRRAPDIAPLHAADLQGLPPALIITAECDVLRDEGEAYAERLREAGVPTVLARYDGMPHGFLTLVPDHAQARAAVDLSLDEIRTHLA